MKIRWMKIKDYHTVSHWDICETVKQKLFAIMLNSQTHNHFKLDFQKVDQYTGGKWLIHRTKHHKDNQLQSIELPCRISW